MHLLKMRRIHIHHATTTRLWTFSTLYFCLRGIAVNGWSHFHAVPVRRSVSSSRCGRFGRNTPCVWSAGRSTAGDQQEKGTDPTIVSQAERLRAQAAKARLEAERLESSLALEQIAKLEKRLEKAAVSGTASASASASASAADTSNDDGEEEAVRKKIALMKKRMASNRETDLQRLVSDDSGRQPAFCQAVAASLTLGAPPGSVDYPSSLTDMEEARNILQEETKNNANLSDQEAAELFANVVNCMIITLVDAAAATMVANAPKDESPDYKSTISAVNITMNFMDHSSALFELFLAKGVTTEPVVYSGTTERAQLEKLFTIYVTSTDDGVSEERGDVLRELFGIKEERADFLLATNLLHAFVHQGRDLIDEPDTFDPADFTNMIQKLSESGDLSKEDLKGLEEQFKTLYGSNLIDFISPQPESLDDFGLGQLIDDLQTDISDFEEYMANRTTVALEEEDKDALKEVKEVADVFGELIEFAAEDDEEFVEIFKKNENVSSFVNLFNEVVGGNVTEDELEIVRTIGGFFRGLKQNFNIDIAQEVKVGLESSKRLDVLSKEDPTVTEKVLELEKTFSGAILEPENLPKREHIDQFNELLLGNPDAFQLTSRKPRDVYLCYLIEGVNKLGSGDALIARLEEMVEGTDLKDKLRFFWVRIPIDNELTEAEIEDVVSEAAEVEGSIADKISSTIDAAVRPTLLITGPDIVTPVSTMSDGLKSNILGFASISYFVLSCFTPPGADITSIFKISSSSWENISALFAALFLVQSLHEVGHITTASIRGVKIAFPVIIPWPWTGLFGTKTELLSPPRNTNALFDVAASGPISGMLGSIVSLVVGLKLTLTMDQTLLLDLPRLPLDTLEKTSWLTSSIVESVAGFDVLSSFDPTSSTVPCHPLTIAGYVGIIVNALSLLPGNRQADGGRMSAALNGSNSVAFAFPATISLFFLLIQGYREWEVSKLLLSYLWFSGFYLKTVDLPCVNEVDKAGGPRGIIFLATSALAFIALSPAL